MRMGEAGLAAFRPDHLDGAVRLSRQAGWPHRREDWATVLSLGRGTVALADGRVVATAITTPFGDDAASIAMVIVDEGMRGRGLGLRLMDAALAAAEGRQCRLVATEAGLPLYEKLGFRQTGRIVQHQGEARPDGAGTGDAAWADTPPLDTIAALDRAACGLDRSALLRRLAREGRVALLGPAAAPRGFAVLRPFGRGEVVGPVVAATAEDARALVAFAIAARPGAFLRVDTPADTDLAPWLTDRGLVHVGGAIPMTRGDARPLAAKPVRTFALASQALG